MSGWAYIAGAALCAAAGSVAGNNSDGHRVEMHDLEFVLYEVRPGRSNEPRKPVFRVSAQRCTLAAEDTWRLENARAVIFEPEGRDSRLKAGRGTFDDAAQAAHLEEGVTLDRGPMHIDLVDLTWLNQEQVAFSNKPLTLIDGDTNLTASAMTYYPQEKRLVLKNVSGRLHRKEEFAS